MDMPDTSSSNISSPIWSSESDISCQRLNSNDQLEGIFYRTHVSESKLNILFVSLGTSLNLMQDQPECN